MAANGISTQQYKADRQLAKLQLAAIKRAATGRRSTLDITQLPTVYASGNNDTNQVVNNPNVGGLVIGRPWISGPYVVEGLWRNVYTGYYPNDIPGVLDATPISSGPVGSLWEDNVTTENITYEYKGYIRANFTGTWNFSIYADDAATFWIGPRAFAADFADAIIDFSDNATHYGSADLVEGNYYPIRLLYGNGGGSGVLNFQWTNGLTESRAVALDAAVLPNDLNSMFSTDIGGMTAGLMTPGVVKTTDKGGILTFDGAHNSGEGIGYASTYESFNSDFSVGMTVSVWANIATGSGGWSRLIDFGNNENGDNIIMCVSGMDSSKLLVSAYQGNTPGNVQMADIVYDQWKLYTWTADGSNWKLYIDDQLVYTYVTDALPTSVQRFHNYIGGSNWVVDPTLKGSIASVELYNRSLNIDEIKGLYNERKGRFV